MAGHHALLPYRLLLFSIQVLSVFHLRQNSSVLHTEGLVDASTLLSSVKYKKIVNTIDYEVRLCCFLSSRELDPACNADYQLWRQARYLPPICRVIRLGKGRINSENPCTKFNVSLTIWFTFALLANPESQIKNVVSPVNIRRTMIVWWY